jgi:transposase-like protein
VPQPFNNECHEDCGVPTKPQRFVHTAVYGEEDLPRIGGVYRLNDGLACTIWLERRGTQWEVAGLAIHAERDIVPIGPVAARHVGDDEDLLAIDTGSTTVELAKQAGDETPAAVTARVLRNLPIGSLVSDLREGIFKTMEEGTHADEFRKFLAGEFSRRPGRRGRPDAFYAEIAQHYVRRLEAGSLTPVRDIAEDLRYSTSMVNNWVSQARKRGLLTEAPPGRAGGDLTTRAAGLLGATSAESDPEVAPEGDGPQLSESSEEAPRLSMRSSSQTPPM